MILHFTGTGNSKFVADCLIDVLSDEAVSMNDVLKSGERLIVSSNTPYVFVAPVYAWRYPLVIENLLHKAELSGNSDVYCLATCESQSGKTGKYLEKIVSDKGMNFLGFQTIPMPNHYILAQTLPTPEEADQQLDLAVSLIKDIARKIRENKSLEEKSDTPFAGIMSGIVNTVFSRFLISSRNFKVSDGCISCGRCQRQCPVNNITLKDGRPTFGTRCIWCFGCIQNCPKGAIDIGEKTRGKQRGICPDYREWIKNS